MLLARLSDLEAEVIDQPQPSLNPEALEFGASDFLAHTFASVGKLPLYRGV